uniref:Heparanase-like protein 2 n=1 Tax=Aegilops tauschii TaxID=37682 RepID=M8BGD1_AEGTA
MAAPAGVLLLCLLVLSGPPYAAVAAGEKATVSVRAVTAISHTDDDFICATLDWWPRDKCNYGMCPWHNSSIINLDLYSPILYNAVKAFNSLRIRLGGSLQDQITYKVGKHYADCPSFRRNDDRLFGFTDGCLAMNRWDELNIFFRRTNTTVTFGLNALRGRRKAAENGSTLHVGGWDGRNARDLMRYTVSKGYRVESWELGNELCAGGVEAKVKAAQYGKDVLRLRRMVEKVYNGTGHLPKVLAPGGFYDGPWFSEMLRVSGPGVVDGVTHHIYNLGSGKDKELINKMQDPYYLDKVAQTFSDMEATVRESGPWSSAWVGESGGAYNSGGKDVSDRFANSFWYLDQLGMSAVFGTKEESLLEKAGLQQAVDTTNAILGARLQFTASSRCLSTAVWMKARPFQSTHTRVALSHGTPPAMPYCSASSGRSTMTLLTQKKAKQSRCASSAMSCCRTSSMESLISNICNRKANGKFSTRCASRNVAPDDTGLAIALRSCALASNMAPCELQ